MQSKIIELLTSNNAQNVELATTLATSQGWDIEKIIADAGFNGWKLYKAESFKRCFEDNFRLEYKATFNPQIFQHFGQARRLILENLKLKNCSFFNSMPYLCHLTLDKNQIDDINGLIKTPAIKTLFLQENQLATAAQLAILSQLKQLTWLNLSDNPIQELDIWLLPPPIDNLSISNTRLQQVDFLNGWNQLRTLYISENNFSNGLRLPNLPNLSTLALGKCKLQEHLDYSMYPNLFSLFLNDNKLTEMGDFSKLEKISSLMLGGNRITHISAANLPPNIKNLNLMDSPILTDISELAAFHNLEFLNIRGCPKITKKQLQIIKKDNRKLYIEGAYEYGRYD